MSSVFDFESSGPAGGGQAIDQPIGGGSLLSGRDSLQLDFINTLEDQGMGAFRGFTQDVVNLDWGGTGNDSKDARAEHFYTNVWNPAVERQAGQPRDWTRMAEEMMVLANNQNQVGTGVIAVRNEEADRRFGNMVRAA